MFSKESQKQNLNTKTEDTQMINLITPLLAIR